MNLWITKIGIENFTENEIDRLEKLAGKLHTLTDSEFTSYKSSRIHYISFSTSEEFGSKKYNSVNDGELIAYSGLVVAGNSSYKDYRNVANLKEYINDYKLATKDLRGQYALIRATEHEFECFTDFLGAHKIFYYRLSNGEILISNSVRCIQLIKGANLNYDFYVNWIAFGGIYGYETEDKDIKALPEFGHIKWTKSGGLVTDSTSNISSLVFPEEDLSYYIRETASDFKNSIHYITDFHESVLPLSGGYDSRLILEPFTLFDTSNLECYTYRDKNEDVIYAKKLAKYYNLNHEVLEPENYYPDIEASDMLFYPCDAFLDYGKIFGFQFREQKTKYTKDGLKVLLKGDGGHTPNSFRIFSSVHDNAPEKAINHLVNKLSDSQLLKDNVEAVFWNNIETYYKNKYSGLLRQKGSALILANLSYLLERFGNYQSHKLINGYQLNDIYLPFANQNFFKALFISPENKLWVSRKGSIHHMLHKELMGNHSKPINFADGIHWEANKLYRIEYRLRKRFKNKMKLNNSKYSSGVRTQFFEDNKDKFKEIIASSQKNEIWDYFDYGCLFEALDTGNIKSYQRKAVFRLVPLIQKFQ